MNSLVLLIQLCYIVPSMALYLVMVAYLLLCRDPEFSSAFHTIFVVRAPADLLQVIVSLVAFRLPLVGWQAVLDWPWLAKGGFVLSQYVCLLELFAQLLLSVNRLTAIAFPLTHRWMWSPRSTMYMFLVCALLATLPTAVRLPQPAGYLKLDDVAIPRLQNKEDQKLNSAVSCVIYSFFCVACFLLNIIAVWILSRQRRDKLFDQQHQVAIRVQTNLLIYSCSFTFSILAMTVFQCLLALEWFPVGSQFYPFIVISLTVAADVFALCNPWLLLLLSAPFRKKFLRAHRLPKIFTDRSTTET